MFFTDNDSSLFPLMQCPQTFILSVNVYAFVFGVAYKWEKTGGREFGEGLKICPLRVNDAVDIILAFQADIKGELSEEWNSHFYLNYRSCC